MDNKNDYCLNIYLLTTDDHPLLGKGHILASEQFHIPGKQMNAELNESSGKSLKIKYSEQDATIKDDQFTIIFNKKTGRLTSFISKNRELIHTGFCPNFRRAPTDNDIGNDMPNRCKIWFDATENITMRNITFTPLSSGNIEVIAKYTLAETLAGETITYMILPDGKVKVNCKLIINDSAKKKLPELPRFGLNFTMPAGFNKIEWQGRGPFENYPDRNTAAFIGHYTSTVDEQFVPYVRPQENGYKTDVTFLEIKDNDGYGLDFFGDLKFCFSALPFTYDEMKGFKQAGKHAGDLIKQDFTDLNIDLTQMGVGGDDSWGAQTHPQYLLPAKNYEYSFYFKPIQH